MFISCELQLPGKGQAFFWEKGRMEVWADLPAPGLGWALGVSKEPDLSVESRGRWSGGWGGEGGWYTELTFSASPCSVREGY